MKVYVLKRSGEQEGWLPHSSVICQASVLSSVDSGDSHVTSWVSCLVPCHGEDYSDHCLQLHGKPTRTQVSQLHTHTPFSFTDHNQNHTLPPNILMSHCVSKSSIKYSEYPIFHKRDLINDLLGIVPKDCMFGPVSRKEHFNPRG